MRGTWVLALAAGATLAMGMPSDAAAQSRSIRDRWEQAARRSEREDDRENARERNRDRERARAQAREREQERIRERERERIRARERERLRQLERERERIRARERELERERARLRDRERELERARARRAESIRERWERQRRIEAAEQRRRDRDRDRDDDDDDDGYYRGSRNGNGPAFCRSGEGHPVYGREWCRRRGYDLGRGRGWERDSRWGNIVFRDSNRRRNERLSRSVLASLLGSALLTRFEAYGRQYGTGPVSGYWMPENGNVLQLNIGSIPIARLIDLNRDGRVDNLLLRR